MKKIYAAFAGKGAHMLDAPVSGGPQGAASRKLAIWVGGDKGAFDRHKPCSTRSATRRLHRADRLRHGRQARAQHVRLRHRLRAGRDLRDGREGGLEPLALWEAVRQGAAAAATPSTG